MNRNTAAPFENWRVKPVQQVPDMCKILGISRSLGYKLIKEGQIPSIKLGERRVVVPTHAIVEMLEAR